MGKPTDRIWYGVCGMWTDDFSYFKGQQGVPHCRVCGGPGYETTREQWDAGAAEQENGWPHYAEFLRVIKGFCMKDRPIEQSYKQWVKQREAEWVLTEMLSDHADVRSRLDARHPHRARSGRHVLKEPASKFHGAEFVNVVIDTQTEVSLDDHAGAQSLLAEVAGGYLEIHGLDFFAMVMYRDRVLQAEVHLNGLIQSELLAGPTLPALVDHIIRYFGLQE